MFVLILLENAIYYGEKELKEIFDAVYVDEQFAIFSVAHINALLSITFTMFGIFSVVYFVKDRKFRNILKSIIIIFMIFVEISWHLWAGYAGIWHVNHALPLHLCSLGAILGIWMLFTNSYKIFEVLYFWSFAGSLQAILTPDLRGYNYPHFHYFWYFISHAAVILAVFWMLIVERVRPTWKSLRKVIVLTNLYAIVVYPINLVTGGNYLLLMQKPIVPTLADYLDVWPGYLFWLEIVGILVVTICYLPYAISDSKLFKLITSNLVQQDT